MCQDEAVSGIKHTGHWRQYSRAAQRVSRRVGPEGQPERQVAVWVLLSVTISWRKKRVLEQCAVWSWRLKVEECLKWLLVVLTYGERDAAGRGRAAESNPECPRLHCYVHLYWIFRTTAYSCIFVAWENKVSFINIFWIKQISQL